MAPLGGTAALSLFLGAQRQIVMVLDSNEGRPEGQRVTTRLKTTLANHPCIFFGTPKGIEQIYLDRMNIGFCPCGFNDVP